MKNLTLETIARVCGGTYHGPAELAGVEVSSIVTDSRKAAEGTLFVPIKGARVDGHSFIPQVMEAGALATLSEEDLGETSYPYIRIASSLQAVKDIAEEYLKILQIPVVGITGSVGKTSTKEMIAAVLSVKYNVLKTAGNFNNELGLPLTVFNIRDEHEIAVLEMGISDFGEMTRLARIDRPDVGVFTNIGWCHLENLKTRDGILKAKTEMIDWIKDGGTIIVNGDDDKLCTVQAPEGKKLVAYGMKDSYPVWADEVAGDGLKGMVCRIHLGGESRKVHIPLPGEHMVYNALAAAAVGEKFGMTLEQICQGIESLQSLGGRFHMIEKNGMIVVDDCYNANPVSMKASLKVLEDGSGRRVAILGDMGELGTDEKALHEEVGTYAGERKIDALYTAGTLTQALAAKAEETNPSLEVKSFTTLEELLQNLPRLTKQGDTILVKASHFMHFEKVVEALTK